MRRTSLPIATTIAKRPPWSGKVQNDFLRAIDDGCGLFLILLNLSAAFDTVDHDILLRRLEESVGLSGLALRWMDSYLRGRSQPVTIDGRHQTQLAPFKYGVQQGSVLGPILFTIFTIPIGYITRKYDLELHLYTPMTPSYNYVYFGIKSPTSQWEVLSTLQACVGELRVWMAANKLCLNDAKTEFLTLCAPWHRSTVEVSSLGVGLLAYK